MSDKSKESEVLFNEYMSNLVIKELTDEHTSLKKEQININDQRQQLLKTMKKNFEDNKQQIEYLINMGVEPKKICEKFQEARVPIDFYCVKKLEEKKYCNNNPIFLLSFFVSAVTLCFLLILYGFGTFSFWSILFFGCMFLLAIF